MSTNRRTRGQFTSLLPLHTALDLAAKILLEAADGDRDSARRVSKGAYDRIRRTGGAPGALSAEGLRQRVGAPWSEVVALALAPAADRGKARGHIARRPDSPWDEDLVLRGIRAAAHKTGATSASAYDEFVHELERGRRRRGLPPLGLPGAATIAAHLGSWQAALEAADIVPKTVRPMRRAAPAHETLDWVITQTGLLPRRTQFEDLCRAHDIPLGRDGRNWDQVVRETRALRAARGEQTPDVATRASDWPGLPEGCSPPLSTGRRAKRHTKADAITSLQRMAERHLGPGERLTEKRYRAACVTDPELIAASLLGRHGRFQDLAREAGVG